MLLQGVAEFPAKEKPQVAAGKKSSPKLGSTVTVDVIDCPRKLSKRVSVSCRNEQLPATNQVLRRPPNPNNHGFRVALPPAHTHSTS